MDRTICANESSRREAVSARCQARGGAILPETASVARVQPPCRSLSVFERKAMIQRRFSTLPIPIRECTWRFGGGWTTKTRLRWTRFRFHMSLARLRLCHGQRSAAADPRSLAVAGSDPPSRHASIGIGQDGDVPPHPPLRCGVAPIPSVLAGRLANRGRPRLEAKRCRLRPKPSGTASPRRGRRGRGRCGCPCKLS